MQKTSWLLLLLLGAVAILAAYHAMLEKAATASFISFFGLTGFMLLCISLIIGPLAVLKPKMFGQLIEPRRAVGIAAFVFVVLHVLLAVAYVFKWNVAIMLKFLPMQIGVVAVFILFILTVTSSDYALKKLGPWWKRVQQFNYFAFVLSFAHFIFQSKVFSEGTSINSAEIALLALGVLVIILQVTGFIMVRKRMAKIPAQN